MKNDFTEAIRLLRAEADDLAVRAGGDDSDQARVALLHRAANQLVGLHHAAQELRKMADALEGPTR